MLVTLIFILLVGACVGSFLNVVAYRLPEGRSIVHPPSACPSCGHKLAARDNVPVLGWILLRGRCRYCGVSISPQYPVVEACTALIFAGWFAVCYMSPLRPGFSAIHWEETAVLFAISLLLVGSLIAATLIDARYYIIPLQIPWLVTAVGVVLIPIAVWMFPQSVGRVELPPMNEAPIPRLRLAELPTEVRGAGEVRAGVVTQPDGAVVVSAAPWVSARAALAGMLGAVGLAVALVLLRLGVLKVSFAVDTDPPDAEDADPPDPQRDPDELVAHDENVPMLLLLMGPILGVIVASLITGEHWASADRYVGIEAPLAGIVGGYVVTTVLLAVGSALSRKKAGGDDATDQPHDDGVVFEPDPNTRREMLKEIAFLAFPIAGLILGAVLAPADAAWADPVHVLGGTLLGYLIGGGVVWLVRVLGSLGFGKEAMGLGDVHLMGAVGAVAGWEVALAAFFLAAFLGIVHAIVTVGMGTLMASRGRQMPFGPQLAGATLVCMVLREPIVANLALAL